MRSASRKAAYMIGSLLAASPSSTCMDRMIFDSVPSALCWRFMNVTPSSSKFVKRVWAVYYKQPYVVSHPEKASGRIRWPHVYLLLYDQVTSAERARARGVTRSASPRASARIPLLLSLLAIGPFRAASPHALAVAAADSCAPREGAPRRARTRGTSPPRRAAPGART